MRGQRVQALKLLIFRLAMHDVAPGTELIIDKLTLTPAFVAHTDYYVYHWHAVYGFIAPVLDHRPVCQALECV